MRVEYIVPYCEDGGVVCMYAERIFNDIVLADAFLKVSKCECGGNGAVHNGWEGEVHPFGQVSIRVVEK